MIRLESNTLKNYYGESPKEYDLKFIHYSLDVEDNEYEEIYNDLKNIKEEIRNSFLIYFSHVKDFNKILYNSKIIMDKFGRDMYLRIRNQDEYDKYKKSKSSILLLIGLKELKEINIEKDDIVLQINNISELSIKELDELLNKYNIRKISVGQIAYITNEHSYLLEELSKMYRVKNNDQLELEKNNKLTNDLYTVEEYKNIYNAINNIVNKSIGNDNTEKFIDLFYRLANEIYYAEDDTKETKIVNHTLIGPIVNKKCACEGYSKLLSQICSLLGIESIIVSGGGSKEEGGHVWNKVKINDKWYNADLTSQSYSIHNKENKNYCLVDDSQMKYKSTSPFDQVCDESYIKNKKDNVKPTNSNNSNSILKYILLIVIVIASVIIIKKVIDAIIQSNEEIIEDEPINETLPAKNETVKEPEKTIYIYNYPFETNYYDFTYEYEEHVMYLDNNTRLVLYSGVLIDNTKIFVTGNIKSEKNGTININTYFYDKNHKEIGNCEQEVELSSEIVQYSCQKAEEELKDGKQFEEVEYYKIEIKSFNKNN